MTATLQRPHRILVVEDNDADVELLREALTDAVPEHLLEALVDGDSALRYFDEVRRGRHDAPDLVLLDLNLPGASGLEVLAEVKSDPQLKKLPVVVLSTSQAAADIEQCYGLNANSYVVKASNFADFVRDIDGIAQYWFDVVERPNWPSSS